MNRMPMARCTPSIPRRRPANSGNEDPPVFPGDLRFASQKSVCPPCLICLINTRLMARALLAGLMYFGPFQVDAEMPVKPIGRRWVHHMRHGMHARGNGLSVLGNPDGPAVP